jgi:hypothetical protein
MKKLMLTAAFAVVSLMGISQDIDRKEIKFDFIRLPLKPLVKSGDKNAKGEIIPEYLKKNEEMRTAFNKKKEEAEQKYLMDLALYQEEVKREDQRYQKEMEAYNKKSAAKKVFEKQVLEEGKPIKKAMYPPSKQTITEERYNKVFNHDALAGEYLRPDGFGSGNVNAALISVTMLGFESSVDFKSKQNNVISKNSAGQATTTTVTVYWYEVKYRHPMRLKVVSPSMGVVSDDLMFNDDKTFKSGEFKSDYECRNAWNSSKDATLTRLEDQVVNENFAAIRTQLNNQYGYSKTNRTADLYNVSSKKVDYTNFNKAYESAFEGLMLLYEGVNPTRAKEKLSAAAAIWDSELATSTPKDKKSRVNADVTTALLFNIIEANIWLGNFNRAEDCLNKLNLMDLSRKERNRLEEARTFFKDMKERAAANA